MPERVKEVKVKEEKKAVLLPEEVPEELTLGKALQVREAARAPAVVVYNKHELLVNLKPLVRKTDEEVIPVLRDPYTKRTDGFLTQFELMVPTSHRSRFSVLDFMHEFPMFKPDDDLLRVVRELEDKRVRGAPVVDEEGKLLGVVDYFDLLRLLKHHLPGEPELKVKDVMRTGEEYAIDWNEKVNKAWHKLINKFLPGLVVVAKDEENKVKGIITYKEFVKTNRWFIHREGEHMSVPMAKVKTIMMRGVPSLSPEDSVTVALDKFLVFREPVIPVVDEEGRYVGALFVEDLVRALARLPRKAVEKSETVEVREKEAS
ncbi:CBS domain-containing protein [Ignicoccus hospitalis]|uniref:CBS domain-containing protein n=1 Tax=Ignicoccus hospitalis TaxID=160233 RepID=UPI0011D11948|nr:CBS domain-containing protein [Ignicoccus hospitalis]HIH90592.1 CBS domain-containing protein [Desulfurococcaceae archaeon]